MPFMDLKRQLPRSQKPAIGHYPEPDESNPKAHACKCRLRQ
jgi:hypothetical protein